MALASLLLVDASLAAASFQAFYSDTGVLPRSVLLGRALNSPIPWSLYFVGGSPSFIGFLLVLSAIAAVALLIGYRTRLAAVASWVLLASLQARNPLLIHGGDNILRLMLFWSLFLPLGACWSVDRIRKKGATTSNETETRASRIASLAFVLQLCFIYWFGAVVKTDPAWHSEGSAVYLALSLPQFNTWLGSLLAAHLDACRFLTHLVLWIEILGPCLLFIPVWNGLWRLLAFVVLVGLHIGFGLCLKLGTFSFIASAGWIAILPDGLWDWIERRRSLGRRLERLRSSPRFLRIVAAFERWFVRPVPQISTTSPEEPFLRFEPPLLEEPQHVRRAIFCIREFLL